MHAIADYKYGLPLGVLVEDTLQRKKVEDNIAHKIVGKLGGFARYTLARRAPS